MPSVAALRARVKRLAVLKGSPEVEYRRTRAGELSVNIAAPPGQVWTGGVHNIVVVDYDPTSLWQGAFEELSQAELTPCDEEGCDCGEATS